MRLVAFCLLLFPLAAQAHARGFHKKLQIVVQARKIQVLVTLDIDGGTRTQVLRAGADVDKNGTIDTAEAQALKARLVTLASRPLRLSLSGYAVRPALVEAKVNLREDRTVSDAGLSIAALLEAELPQPLFAGMELSIEDEAPDASHVRVEAVQDVGGERKAEDRPSVEGDLQPGDRLALKLQGPM